MDEINSWKILDPAKRRTRKSKDRSEKKKIFKIQHRKIELWIRALRSIKM